MRFSTFKLLTWAFLLSVSPVMGNMSYINEGSILNLEKNAELFISKNNILENFGTITATDKSKINMAGYIENNNIIELTKMRDGSGIKLMLDGSGEINMTEPEKDAVISLIKTIGSAFQTLSGKGENANSEISNVQINSGTSIEKKDSLTLQVQESDVSGTLILEGDTEFS